MLRDDIVNMLRVWSQPSPGPDNPGMSFSTRLRAFRKAARLSQDQLAELCGRSGQSWIGNFERGKQTPNSADIPKLAKALGIHPGELFSDLPATSQPAQLDRVMLESSIVAVKEAAKRNRLTFDAFDAAPIIAYAYSERVLLPREMSKDAYQVFDRLIEQKLLGVISDQRGEPASGGGARSVEETPARKKAAGDR